MVTLSDNSFIDQEYFEIQSGTSVSIGEENKLYSIINSVETIMENICGRKLKARNYSYLIGAGTELDPNYYDAEYSIFDPPPKTVFWFPTYPINSITKFIINDVEILASTDYQDDTGYILYNHTGKLIYKYGFNTGYNQNVKIIWNGGYTSSHTSYAQLQFINYCFVKEIWDSSPGDSQLLSEKIGTYSYTKMSPVELSKFFGVSPFIFHNIFKFKRFAFA